MYRAVMEYYRVLALGCVPSPEWVSLAAGSRYVYYVRHPLEYLISISIDTTSHGRHMRSPSSRSAQEVLSVCL